MKNENYITIQGWMVNELKLKGNELIVYALIYGFTQDGKNEFTGSLNYIKKAVGVSRSCIIKIINRLIKKKFIKKQKFKNQNRNLKNRATNRRNPCRNKNLRRSNN